jgi:hypothetical protein
MRMLRYRHKLIKIRTMSKNSLQALALQAGVAKRSGLFTRAGKQELDAALMSPAMQWQREHWLQLLQPLDQQVLEAMAWLKAQSKDDVCIARLRTHPGIGLLSSLVWCIRCNRSLAFATLARWLPMRVLIRSNVPRRNTNVSLGSVKPARAYCAT